LQSHEQQHKAKADCTYGRVGSRRTRLDHARNRPVRYGCNTSLLRVAEEARPPIYPDRLRGFGKVFPGRAKLSMCSRVNNALGCTPELIDGFVRGVGIKQTLAERVPASPQGAIPYGNGGPQPFPVDSAEPAFPSGSLVPRRMGNDAANRIIDPLPDAERVKQAARLRRSSFLLLLWRGPMAKPLVILPSLVSPVFADSHQMNISLYRYVFLFRMPRVKL